MLRLGAMKKIMSFRQLLVWQKSMDLAVRCYETARKRPKSEQPVLGYQIRKSAVSTPSNIAEGFSRHSTPFYIQHKWMSHASGAELETQVELGRRVKFIGGDEADILIADSMEVARMINGLVRPLERPTRYQRLGPDAFRPDAYCLRPSPALRPEAQAPGPRGVTASHLSSFPRILRRRSAALSA